MILTKPESERAASPETLCEILRERDIRCLAIEDNFTALERLKNSNGDVKIIAGSLYLIGSVRKFFVV